MSVKQINNMNWRYGAHEKHIKQWFCNINLLGHSSCTVDFCRASVWRFLFFLLNLSHTRASPSPKPFTMVQLTPLIPCDILLQWAAWILGLLWSKCLLWPWWWRREFQYTPWNYIWRGSIAFISTYLKTKKDDGIGDTGRVENFGWHHSLQSWQESCFDYTQENGITFAAHQLLL